MAKNYDVADLLNFIDASPSPFHCAAETRKRLAEAGFTELKEKENWTLEKNKKYFLAHNGTAALAFTTGDGAIEKHGFRMIGAHGDAPTFKIKPKHEMVSEKRFVKLNTESYGGPIMSTWFDRPLSIAGRLILKGETAFAPKEILINLERPMLCIPNLAVHLNREINTGYKYNAQTDMLPIIGIINDELEKENFLLKLIAKETGVNFEDILDFDLNIFEATKACTLGPNNEFFSAPRLDDQWMAYCGMQAIIDAKDNNYTNVYILLDNEETGSRSENGADSTFIRDTLYRIALALGKTEEEFIISLRNSVAVSADLAHGFHPSYDKDYDPINRAILGKGPAIKYSSCNHVATNAFNSAIFAEICRKASVPFQYHANRSDKPSGGTIGPIVASRLCTNVVDIGAPVLGMHSIREFGAVADNEYTVQAFTAFYEID